MWGPDQREAFDRDGVVTLRGAFDPDAARAMEDATWRFVEARTSLRRTDPASWPTDRHPGVSLKKLKRHSSFDAVVDSPAVVAALDDLFGAGGWSPGRSGAQILFSFPDTSPDRWRVPAGGWHMDAPFFRRVDPPRAVKLFAVGAPLPPRGGATMVLAGTPALVGDYARALDDDRLRQGNGNTWRRFLERAHPALTAFIADDGAPGRNDVLMAPIAVGDRVIELRELGGEPGDVHVTHINLFHSVSANSLDRPRLLVTHLVTPDDLRDDGMRV